MNTVQIQELQKTIQSSFLLKDQKDYLMQYLNTNGENEQFYKVFNQYLINELQKKDKQFRNSMNNFENNLIRLDNELNSRKEKAEKNLDEKLSKIDPTDLSLKAKIWDEYYRILEEMRTEYEEKLKKIYSQELFLLMQS
jgi:G:T/U-mismatch repair DNA glycosylase